MNIYHCWLALQQQSQYAFAILPALIFDRVKPSMQLPRIPVQQLDLDVLQQRFNHPNIALLASNHQIGHVVYLNPELPLES